MTKPPAEPPKPPKDPNIDGFRAILDQKKKNKAAAEALRPTDLTQKQKPRVKPQMRRRP